jgi:hypothetical protein
MGMQCYNEGDHSSAFLTKAAEVGDIKALVYMKGNGIERDEEKFIYHSEKAAIGVHPTARYNL